VPFAQVPQIPWTGGIDRSRPSVESNPQSAYELKNVRTTTQGVKRVRGGLRSYYRADDGDPVGANGAESSYSDYSGVQAMLPYQYGDDYRLITITHDGMYYRGLGETVKVANSALVADPVQMIQFNKAVLITSIGTSPNVVGKSANLHVWNGDAIEKVPTAPNIRFMRSHYNRLIAAGNYEEPTLWYASFVGDYSNWDPYAGADADLGGFVAEIPSNRSITGISPSHYGGFYISTVESLHFINGRSPTEFTHSLVSDGLGNFGHHTLMNIRGTILGWNHSGCYILTDSDRQGGVSSMEMSAPIREVYYAKVHRVPERFFSVNNHEQGEYVTYMPHIENADYTVAIIYNYRYQQWYWYEIPFKLYSATVWGKGHDSLMLVGDDGCLVSYFQDGQLLDHQDVTSLESEFEVHIETHFMVIGNAEMEGEVKRIGMMLNDTLSTTIDVDYILKNDNLLTEYFDTQLHTNPAQRPVMDSTFVLGTSKLARSNEAIIVKSYEGGSGRYGKLRIKGNASDIGDLVLHGLFFEVEAGGSVR